MRGQVAVVGLESVNADVVGIERVYQTAVRTEENRRRSWNGHRRGSNSSRVPAGQHELQAADIRSIPVSIPEKDILVRWVEIDVDGSVTAELQHRLVTNDNSAVAVEHPQRARTPTTKGRRYSADQIGSRHLSAVAVCPNPKPSRRRSQQPGVLIHHVIEITGIVALGVKQSVRGRVEMLSARAEHETSQNCIEAGPVCARDR